MNKLRRNELISYIIAGILGAVFHFVYEFTGNNPFIGLFFPINESTFEHLKLIFFPIIIVSVFEYYCLNVQSENYIATKFLSAIIGMISTIVLFYTYIGVYGKNVDAVNIAIYYIAMAIAYIFSYFSIKNNRSFYFSERTYFILFCITTLLFMYFTVNPPSIPLFISPV